MSNQLSTYSIQFKGLKVGKHILNFELDGCFFSLFEESEIKEGKLSANVNLTKHSQLLELDVNISGYVEVVCDRCLDSFNLPIGYKGTLFVKFDQGEPDSNEEIVFLPTEESELNIAQYLYESICLSIPYQKYHGINSTKEDDCNKEMLKKIKKHTGSNKTGKQGDPRWDKLKDLKLN